MIQHSSSRDSLVERAEIVVVERSGGSSARSSLSSAGNLATLTTEFNSEENYSGGGEMKELQSRSALQYKVGRVLSSGSQAHSWNEKYMRPIRLKLDSNVIEYR